MVKMAQIEHIRKMFYKEGLSVREISRRTGHHRDTIAKYLDLELAQPPKYKLTKDKPHPVLGPFIPVIDEILTSDQSRPRKQRHTTMRIYHRLVNEYGYQGGYSTLTDYLRSVRTKTREAYLPLQFGLGTQAQVDWGQAIFKLNGVETVAHLFLFRLSASRAFYVHAYPFEKQEAFFDGHRRAFNFIGGVPQAIAYDNLTTAVKKVVVGKDRIEQDNFIALRTHYLFDANFCNPARGNEKGGVEGLVRYVRQNFFVPYPEVRSLEELNEQLHKWCLEHRKKLDLWEAEQKELRALPAEAFPCQRHLEAKVNTYSMIQFETNRYSVPVKYVGEKVTIRVDVNSVDVILASQVIATHPRLFGRKQERLVLDHYLDLFLHKPRALNNSKAFRSFILPPVFEEYRKGLAQRSPKASKEFVRLLMLHRNHPAQLVEEAVEMAMAHKVYSYDGVYNFLIQLNTPTHKYSPLCAEKVATLPAVTVKPPDLARYNRFLEGGGVS